MLARSTILKLYEPAYNGKDCFVFLSKSFNKDEQMNEQNMSKRRRETLSDGDIDPKYVQINVVFMYLEKEVVAVDE